MQGLEHLVWVVHHATALAIIIVVADTGAQFAKLTFEFAIEISTERGSNSVSLTAPGPVNYTLRSGLETPFTVHCSAESAWCWGAIPMIANSTIPVC